MKHTPLYQCHVRDATTLINLKGFARPLTYRGHMVEHRAVREAVSMCDVSHMGELDFDGPDALALVQKLITNDASRLSVNQALYSVMCTEEGAIIDDLVCFRLGQDHFRWVVNVTKTGEDFQWVLKHAAGLNVKVRDISAETALIALQGPLSRAALQRITKADLSNLRYYWFTQTTIHTEHAEVPCLVSRTGYTGEQGYEIMMAGDLASWVWDELLMTGQPLGIVPHGVAARESLRIETGFLLNGNDMDGQTNPFEAGLGWVVKLSKGHFVGREALLKIQAAGPAKKLVGIEIEDQYTVRHGYGITREGKKIGYVTSGPLAFPLSGRNVGLGYVMAEDAAAGTAVRVDIRGRSCRARIIDPVFVPRRAKDEPPINTYSPYGLHFSAEHLWVHPVDGHSVFTIGLSDFGQRFLGDILSISLPKVGDVVPKGAVFGWVDTYRRVFEFVAPLTGEVIEINGSLLNNPGQINAYPYADAGILKIRAPNSSGCAELLSFEAYSDFTSRLRRYDEWSADRRVT